MLSSEQEAYILKNANVPEHIPSLMVGISQAEPFLMEDFLFFAKEDWLIFIGYPLERDFQANHFSQALETTVRSFKPTRIWFISPLLPRSFSYPVKSIEKDQYYRLDMGHFKLRGSLAREVKKSRESLIVEKSRSFSSKHDALNREFLESRELPPRVHELYLRIPQYLSYSSTSLLISAWDRDQELSAFHVVELAAQNFAVYVMGAFSRKNYVSHASDLLFGEMVHEAQKKGKEYIHLGLGVNDGIRKFKMKWGGIPVLEYFAGEISFERNSGPSWLKALVSKL
jgi:hypothetical protein